MAPTNMKAVVIEACGGSDQLKLVPDFAVPARKAGEVGGP